MANDNNNIQLTSDLQQAVGFIKQAIQRSQARALRSVNNEVLSLYYGVGRYVSENSRHNMWGKGAIKSISEQLQKEIPGLTGFGESNIKNMRKFYEEWCDFVNCQPLAADSPVDENKLLAEIRQPLAGDLDWNDFLRVPFSHHVEILSKCKSIDERIFYIHQCAARAWSKYALRDFIAQGLYKVEETFPLISLRPFLTRSLPSAPSSHSRKVTSSASSMPKIFMSLPKNATSHSSTSASPTTYATSSFDSDKISCSSSQTTDLSMVMRRSSSTSFSSIASSTVL